MQCYKHCMRAEKLMVGGELMKASGVEQCALRARMGDVGKEERNLIESVTCLHKFQVFCGLHDDTSILVETQTSK